MGLFRKGKIGIVVTFHRRDLVICSHFRGIKTMSDSQINRVCSFDTILDRLPIH